MATPSSGGGSGGGVVVSAGLAVRLYANILNPACQHSKSNMPSCVPLHQNLDWYVWLCTFVIKTS